MGTGSSTYYTEGSPSLSPRPSIPNVFVQWIQLRKRCWLRTRHKLHVVLAVETPDFEDRLRCWYTCAISLSLLAISGDSSYISTIDIDCASRHSEVKMTDESNRSVLIQIDTQLRLILDEDVPWVTLPIA